MHIGPSSLLFLSLPWPKHIKLWNLRTVVLSNVYYIKPIHCVINWKPPLCCFVQTLYFSLKLFLKNRLWFIFFFYFLLSLEIPLLFYLCQNLFLLQCRSNLHTKFKLREHFHVHCLTVGQSCIANSLLQKMQS